jgi:glycosyltransferase involved in cell wall biosynthesis
VPSLAEKEIIEAELRVENVVVYSYTADVVRSGVLWEQRNDLVFVGGFRHPPNVDAVEHFVRDIWPDLASHLRPETRFYVVGPEAPEQLCQLAGGRIIFTGYVEQLQHVLDRCRVFVAPLRYGAGLKGKLVTALSHGVPCVASIVAIEGMGLAGC